MRSTKKPTGVCSTADTTLKAVSARLELGIGHAVVRPDEDEQRREQHHVVVADEVREAHAGDQACLRSRALRARMFGGLGHVLVLFETRDQAARAALAS